MRLAALALITTAALTASPALADVKAGVDAWSRGDFPAAIREWQGPAAKGDPDAQFDLGEAYMRGRGVPQDLAHAEALFGKAAAQGHLQAADNYGLLLFQRGQHAIAMPYVTAAAERGEPRAEYLLGIALFNADAVPKDWVRAYAFESLAQQTGLDRAKAALAQMDKFIPLEQRQQGVAMASDLTPQIEANRNRQLAAVDLGNTLPAPRGTAMAMNAPPSAMASTRPPMSAPMASAPMNTAPITMPPITSSPIMGAARNGPPGADYSPGAAVAMAAPPPRMAPPQPLAPPPRMASPPRMAQTFAAPAIDPSMARPMAPALRPLRDPPMMAQATPMPHNSTAMAPRLAVASGNGAWRVQLGAFGVAANADAMWNRVKGMPEIAGHAKMLVPAGKVNKLQAGGYASESDAQAACRRLAGAGIICIATKG